RAVHYRPRWDWPGRRNLAGLRAVGRLRHYRDRVRAPPAAPPRTDAADRPVPAPGLRAVRSDGHLCAWRADDRPDRPAVLFSICRRYVADRDRGADHALA